MKYQKIIFLLSLIIGVHFITNGQTELLSSWKKAKADKLYDQFAFVKALTLYHEIYLSDTSNFEIKEKLASCYRLTGSNLKSEEAYKIIALDTVNRKPIHLLYYAEALKTNGKYKESKKWYRNYNKITATDSRGVKNVQAEHDYHILLRKDSAKYKLSVLEINSVLSDFGPAYFEDQIVYTSSKDEKISVKYTHTWNQKPFLDLYYVNKNEDGSLTSDGKFPQKINSIYHDGPAVFTKDGQEMYFTRNNFLKRKFAKSDDGTNHLIILHAIQKDNEWTEVKPFTYNNTEYSVGHPAISLDGNILFFSSDMPGGYGGSDLYFSKKVANSWSKPVNLGSKVNTEGNEMFPFIHENGTLYFASDGHLGLGGLDIFQAQSYTDTTFENVKNMGYPINSEKDDFSFIIDSAKTSGYFASNRTGGKGDDDIYYFESQIVPLKVNGMIKEKFDLMAIDSAEIHLLDIESNAQKVTHFSNEGGYSFNIDRDKKYSLSIRKHGFSDFDTLFSSAVSEELTSIVIDVLLEKDFGISLFGLIQDQETNEPINSVHAIFIDNITGKVIFNDTLQPTGSFKIALKDKKLDNRISYNIKLERDGYLGKVITYNDQITEPEDINLNEKLKKELTLDKIDIGTDIGKIIDIQPIYFDVNKYNIRPDAATELDKVVKVMQENPNLEIELGSHTDARGSDAYNLKLSDQRAKASAAYIVEKGIDSHRIVGKGFGENKLVNRCKNGVNCSQEEHQANRRTEFKITKL